VPLDPPAVREKRRTLRGPRALSSQSRSVRAGPADRVTARGKRMKRTARWFGMVWVVAVVVAMASPAHAQRGHIAADNGSGARGNPGVLPPSSNPYGRSYGEWGAAWWQWALSLPLSESPLNDPTGAHIAAGQSGPVWFLSGTFCPDLV